MNARPLPRRRTTSRSALDRATRRLDAEMRMVREIGWDSWAWARELLPEVPQTTTEEGS